jgi:hypothetical protein
VDISYDLILVFVPLRLFWDVRLERGAKLLVLAGFAGSLLTVCATGLAGVLMVLPMHHLPQAARSTIQSMPLHIIVSGFDLRTPSRVFIFDEDYLCPDCV